VSGDLFLDCETFSPVPIARGTYAYAEPAEVMLVTWAMDDEEPQAWDCAASSVMPKALDDARRAAKVYIAHNANFDRVLLRGLFSDAPHCWRCTRAQAYAHGLPGELDALCAVLRVEGKLARGKDLIRLFCIPRADGGRNDRKTHPKEWAEIVEYARQDIRALRSVARKLPAWNYPYAGEAAIWRLDQTINDRGILIDQELARAAIACNGTESKRLARETSTGTLGLVGSATQRDRLLKHLNEAYDLTLPDLRSDTIDKALDTDLPEEARELLRLRRDSAKASIAKYAAAMRSVSRDRRLRGTLQYCGAARTGRWSGRIFQPHNMVRPTLEPEDIDQGIEALKAGALTLVQDEPMTLLSEATRGLLIAPEGRKLVVSDLSNIEGRILAWLAGEEWKLHAFREFDAGRGPDLYNLIYARQFGKEPDDVTKDERQIGKVEELSMGYGGGVGALLTIAANYGLNLEALREALRDGQSLPQDVWQEAGRAWEWAKEKRRTYGLPALTYMTCDALKRLWREQNAAIVKLWSKLENAAIAVVSGQVPRIDIGRLVFDRVNNWLRIRLPSGRYLSYPGACVGEDGKLSHLGINPYTKQWGRIGLYGGKLADHVTQGSARDVLAHGMLRAEAAGYRIVLTVHDEIVSETPDLPEFSAEGLSVIMAAGESWTEGLPLAAKGFESKRYRKG
jgi:DNA polymerase